MTVPKKMLDIAKEKFAELSFETETIGIDQIHKILMRLGVADPYNRRQIIENLVAIDLMKEKNIGVYQLKVGIANKILPRIEDDEK